VRRTCGLPELVGAQLLIGRSSACQIVLGDDTVSVTEAEIRAGDVIHLGRCKLKL
jgi:hypothetical protein